MRSRPLPIIIAAAAIAATPLPSRAANELLRFDDPNGPGAAGIFGQTTDVEGDVLVIGAPNTLNGSRLASGQAHCFDLSTSPPTFRFSMFGPDTQTFSDFGGAVATDGVTIAVGDRNFNGPAIDSGKVYLFRVSDGSFIRSFAPATASTNDRFGTSVDVRGDFVLVGTFAKVQPSGVIGAADLYSVSSGQLIRSFTPDDTDAILFGDAVALAGSVAIIGARADPTQDTDAGSLYFFDRDTGAQLSKTYASDALARGDFAQSLDVCGTMLAVGGNNRAYVIDFTDPTNPIERSALSDPDVFSSYGRDVAICGDRLLVSKPLDDFAFNASGGVCMYDVSDPTSPQPIALLTQSDATENDRLGFSLDLNDDLLVIPAYTCDTTGTNDGAGYIFANAPDVTCDADVTGDGFTDVFDFAIIADSFGAGPGATFEQGDVTGDGFVDVFDFAVLADEFGCEAD